MGKVESHRGLIVWQKAVDLAMSVYTMTDRWPRAEMYRLTSQITRAAASVPANIAEGYVRGSTREYCHFLAIARGSIAETETFLVLAVGRSYISQEEATPIFTLHRRNKQDA
jgi:four helix bundle protein